MDRILAVWITDSRPFTTHLQLTVSALHPLNFIFSSLSNPFSNTFISPRTIDSQLSILQPINKYCNYFRNWNDYLPTSKRSIPTSRDLQAGTFTITQWLKVDSRRHDQLTHLQSVPLLPYKGVITTTPTTGGLPLRPPPLSPWIRWPASYIAYYSRCTAPYERSRRVGWWDFIQSSF